MPGKHKPCPGLKFGGITEVRAEQVLSIVEICYDGPKKQKVELDKTTPLESNFEYTMHKTIRIIVKEDESLE